MLRVLLNNGVLCWCIGWVAWGLCWWFSHPEQSEVQWPLQGDDRRPGDRRVFLRRSTADPQKVLCLC